MLYYLILLHCEEGSNPKNNNKAIC